MVQCPGLPGSAWLWREPSRKRVKSCLLPPPQLLWEQGRLPHKARGRSEAPPLTSLLPRRVLILCILTLNPPVAEGASPLPSPSLGPLSLKQDHRFHGRATLEAQSSESRDPRAGKDKRAIHTHPSSMGLHGSTKATWPSSFVFFFNLLMKKILFFLSLCYAISVATSIPHKV